MRNPVFRDVLGIAAFILGALAIVAFAVNLEVAAFLLLLAGIGLTPLIGMISRSGRPTAARPVRVAHSSTR